MKAWIIRRDCIFVISDLCRNGGIAWDISGFWKKKKLKKDAQIAYITVQME